jgi:hypothetical protein
VASPRASPAGRPKNARGRVGSKSPAGRLKDARGRAKGTKKRVVASIPRPHPRPSKQERLYKKELLLAKRGEALAATQRTVTRLRLEKKAPKKLELAMHQELRILLHDVRSVGAALGLPRDSIRGHAYDDGRVIARMRLPLVGKSTAQTLQDLQHQLSKECPACDGEGHVKGHPEKKCPACKGGGLVSSLPPGTFLEGNFLLNPAGDVTDPRKRPPAMRKGFASREARYLYFKGLLRVQFWGSKNTANVGEGMKKMAGHLHDLGFVHPEALYLRFGKTTGELLSRYEKATTLPDGSRLPKEQRRKKGLVDIEQPFQRYAPPVGGTLVRKRKPAPIEGRSSRAGFPSGEGKGARDGSAVRGRTPGKKSSKKPRGRKRHGKARR